MLEITIPIEQLQPGDVITDNYCYLVLEVVPGGRLDADVKRMTVVYQSGIVAPLNWYGYKTITVLR